MKAAGQRRRIGGAAAGLSAAVLLASAARALTPLPPCVVNEAGMSVHDVQPLGEGTGVVVERYTYVTRLEGTVYRPQPAPVPALDGFVGTRVTHCPSGQFVAIPGQYDAARVAAALGATEFLRGQVQSGRRVAAGEMKQAARAVYGAVIELRETEETCACAQFFPQMRPAGMAAFDSRSDVE